MQRLVGKSSRVVGKAKVSKTSVFGFHSRHLAGLTSVTAIAGGSFPRYALRSDGTVLAWGNGSSEQPGNGSGTARRIPVQVNGLTSVTAIAAGEVSAYKLRSDGCVPA